MSDIGRLAELYFARRALAWICVLLAIGGLVMLGAIWCVKKFVL